MQKDEFIQGLLNFLDLSPTPFHAVATMAEMLDAGGFSRLHEGEDWQLEPNGNYYVIRNGSTLAALSGFAKEAVQNVRLFGAHTDSPCLKLKPQPEIRRKGYLQLGAEVYGGALLHRWFDRDLSIAGRVTYADDQSKTKSLLVDWEKPVALIPSLAIHLNREANSSSSVNPQTQLPAVIMLADKELEVSFNELLLEHIQEEHVDIDIDRILDYELCLYDTQPAALVGIDNEFVTSARLDNLLSCYVGLQALLSSKTGQACVLVCNDHEEVGSLSASGADGPFLTSLLKRILGGCAKVDQVLAKSMMFSADNAHAFHPNFADKYDDNHGPIVNQGPVIKINVNQRYATNSVTSGFYRNLSDALGVPYQTFVIRTDMACGSTIGPITSAKLGVRTLDIGAPQWAMHSIRESCGSDDGFHLFKVTTAFFDTDELPD